MNVTTAESTLIYGTSRTYKSSELAQIVEWIYNHTGMRTRMISTETSSAAIFAPYIDAGLLEVLWLQRSHHPRSALRKLIRGEWPVVSGAGLGWRPFNLQTDQVGAYMFEGLTTFSELIMLDLIADGRKINEEVVGQYSEEGEKLGAAGRSHYMAAQNDIMFFLKEAPKALFNAGQGRVQHVFWTAHQNKGQDENKQTVYGPATVGKALTGAIQKEVGLLIHTEELVERTQVMVAGKPQSREVKRVRAYFQSHPDPENPSILWQAGPRVPPSAQAMKSLAGRWPEGYLELTLDPPSHVTDFLDLQLKLRAQATGELVQRMKAAMAARAQAQAQIQAQAQPATPAPTTTTASAPAGVAGAQPQPHTTPK